MNKEYCLMCNEDVNVIIHDVKKKHQDEYISIEYEGKVANDNYILGQKIWKEYGTRYFSFVFPIKLEPNSSINIFEEDSQGKKGKSWMNISVK